MKTNEMIEVLQAAERGEKIEMLNIFLPDDGWEEFRTHTNNWNFSAFDYRIAPKKVTLVERLRNGLKAHCLLDMDDVKVAADRIEELEEILHTNVDRIDNDLLMKLLKKRLQK